MNTKTLLSRGLTILVFAGTLSVSLVLASSPFDIEYPIPELGNCVNKTECKAYCAEKGNYAACKKFSDRHGFSKEKEERLEKVKADGGPGGCAENTKDPESSCRAYCSISSHMKECVLYAKNHGLMKERNLEEAEKVIKALDEGAVLPAECTDQESCRAACEDPESITTARQCFAFAEKAGLLPPGVTKEKAERMFALIEQGKAPFKSPKDFKRCENPDNDEMLNQCIQFGLEAGIIPPEEAEIIKKTGGKGPGGCRGKEQCENYCKAHEDECFRFAEEHNLIPPEERERMKQGAAQFQEHLRSAPPEISACLKETVGNEVFEKLTTGERPPTRDLGEKMRSCFENFFEKQGGEFREGGKMMMQGDGEIHEGIMKGNSNFPDTVKKCLESRLGTEGASKLSREQPSHEMESVIRGCFEEMGNMERERGVRMEEGMTPDAMHNFPGQPGQYKQGGTQVLPPEVSREEMERMIRERMIQEKREQYLQNTWNAEGVHMIPPEGFPSGENTVPPPPEGYLPPPPSPLEPTGETAPTSLSPQTFLGNILHGFKKLLK